MDLPSSRGGWAVPLALLAFPAFGQATVTVVGAVDLSNVVGAEPPANVGDIEPSVVAHDGGGAFLAWLRISDPSHVGGVSSVYAVPIPADLDPTRVDTSILVRTPFDPGVHITALALTTDGTRPYYLTARTDTASTPVPRYVYETSTLGTSRVEHPVAWTVAFPPQSKIFALSAAPRATLTSDGAVSFPFGVELHAMMTEVPAGIVMADGRIVGGGAGFTASGALQPAASVREIFGPASTLFVTQDVAQAGPASLYANGAAGGPGTALSAGGTIPTLSPLASGGALVLTNSATSASEIDCTTVPAAGGPSTRVPCVAAPYALDVLAAAPATTNATRDRTAIVGTSSLATAPSTAAGAFLAVYGGATPDTAQLLDPTSTGAPCSHPSVAPLGPTRMIVVATCRATNSSGHVIAWLVDDSEPTADAGVDDSAVPDASLPPDSGSQDAMAASDASDAVVDAGPSSSGPTFRGGACTCRTALPAASSRTHTWFALAMAGVCASRRRRRKSHGR